LFITKNDCNCSDTGVILLNNKGFFGVSMNVNQYLPFVADLQPALEFELISPGVARGCVLSDLRPVCLCELFRR
jgi:hypothetical protein